MNSIEKNKVLLELTKSLELPVSIYEKAIKRYEDIGEWFDRDASSLKHNNIHIFSQGSFRLGTVTRPLTKNEEYDLDLACNIQSGINTESHSQKELKTIVGKEIDDYRVARGITADIEEKKRCWRLEYADDVSFHIDIVPCIPGNEAFRNQLTESLKTYGHSEDLSKSLSSLSVCITDKDKDNYSTIDQDWPISNPEGYAKWFETRMCQSNMSKSLLAEAQVDEVPLFKRKTPLQKVIQLLKRHRDVMFAHNPDSKPISVIIATIVANAYSGTHLLDVALEEALLALKTFAESNNMTVLNPVNPHENFADKWFMPEYNKYRLQENFNHWVGEVNRHFRLILNSNDVQTIAETASDAFLVKKNANDWSAVSGISVAPSIISAPRNIETAEAKPWSKE